MEMTIYGDTYMVLTNDHIYVDGDKEDPRHDMCMRDYVCILVSFSFFLVVYLCSGTRLHSAHPQLLTVQMSPLCAFALPDQIFCVCVSPRKLHNPNLLCVCMCALVNGG